MKLKIKQLAKWIGAVSIVVLAPLVQANLVKNGGFDNENPLVDLGNITPQFAFWSDSTFVLLSNSIRRSPDWSATFGDDNGSATLTQTLTLDANSKYNFEFWLRCDKQSLLGGGTCDALSVDPFSAFSASLDGVDIALSGTTGPTGTFSRYSGTIMTGGIAPVGNLKFALNDPSGVFTPTLFLDDVFMDLQPACTGNSCNVPEPGSLLLVGVALTAGAIVRRRRQR